MKISVPAVRWFPVSYWSWSLRSLKNNSGSCHSSWFFCRIRPLQSVEEESWDWAERFLPISVSTARSCGTGCWKIIVISGFTQCSSLHAAILTSQARAVHQWNSGMADMRAINHFKTIVLKPRPQERIKFTASTINLVEDP